MSKVLDWNGTTVPPELKSLKPGRYVIEAIDDVPELTPEQERGLEQALRSLNSGRGIPADEAKAMVRGALKR